MNVNYTYVSIRIQSGICLWMCLFICISIFSCRGADNGEDAELARVSEQILKRKDLIKYLPMQFDSAEDSIRVTKLFIDHWVSEQVLNDQALGEIDGLEERIEYKVRDYRNKLILHEYYNYLIETRLDTIVDSVEMRTFYERNIEKYLCAKTRYSYLFMATHLLDIRVPIKLMASKPEDIDYAALNAWAVKNAFVSQIDTLYWAEGEELDGLSSNYSGRLRDLRAGHYPVSWTANYQDKPAQYICKILNTVQPGETLPMWMVEASIKNSIVQDRTRKMLISERSRLVKEAKLNGNAYVQ